MANYVSSHAKKKVRLMRLEQELLRSIQDGVSRDRRLKLAEEVRLARIRVLQATKAALIPRAGNQINEGVTLQAKITCVESMTSEAILQEYEGAAQVGLHNGLAD